MARHGNVVILGRSGYAILAGLADVLHVRAFKRRLMTVSSWCAMRPMSRCSRRRRWSRKTTRCARPSSSRSTACRGVRACLDIALNTSRVPVNVATDWVIQAANAAKEP